MFQKVCTVVTFVFLSFFISTAYSAQTVNINTADAVTLAEYLNGIGASKAQAIIEYRNQNGGFGSVEELENVSGIGPKLIERNRDVISLGEVASPPVVTPSVATPQKNSPATSTAATAAAKPASTKTPVLPAN